MIELFSQHWIVSRECSRVYYCSPARRQYAEVYKRTIFSTVIKPWLHGGHVSFAPVCMAFL